MDSRGPAARFEPLESGPDRARDEIRRDAAASVAISDIRARLRQLTMAQVAASLGVLSAIVLMITAPDLARPGPLEAAAVLILFLGLWITKTVPDHLAAIIFFIAAVSVIGVPPDIALSGFHAGAVWLVLGGLIVGVAIKSTGLGERLALSMLTRASRSYGTMIVGAVALGTVLIFIAPSAIGRIMILMPIVIALAERLGFEAGSPGRNGLVLAASLGTSIPAYAVLPSTIPNVAMMGAAQNLYAIEFTYGGYLLANFPVLAVASLIVLPILICWIFRDRPQPPDDAPVIGAMTGNERRLVVILCVALALWITDSLHGISPAWVALGAGMLCLMPGFGPAREVPFPQGVNIGAWLLVAAFISLGAVINYCGLGEATGTWLVEAFELRRGETAWNFTALTAIGMGVSGAATAMGAPTIMTPLAQQFATATGWPLEGILLAQVPTWFFFPLPHQTPMLLIAMAIARVPIWPATRLLIAFTVIGLVVALPLHFLWLQALGYLP